jgi:indole-3-acetate monooxygenase
MKTHIDHPSFFLPKGVPEKLRAFAGEAEASGKLHERQLETIFENNWLNMFVPRSHGGLELTLPEVLRIEEGLSWSDGSTAWVTTLCSGAAWFIGFIDPALTEEIFTDKKVCFAGSGASSGTASIRKNGYVINGQWKYASGSLHATVFTANCVITEGNKPLYHADNTPVVKTFVMMNDEVTVDKTWNSMGMIATASHSFNVNDLVVDQRRCFIIDAAHAVLAQPVYQFPFLQLAETTLAVNLSGLAVRFVDLAGELVASRIVQDPGTHLLPDLHAILADSKTKLNGYRHTFYKTVDEAWSLCQQRKRISTKKLQEVSDASLALAHRSRQIVDDLFPFCGLKAADTREEINRVWRNLHTASQHALFACRKC